MSRKRIIRDLEERVFPPDVEFKVSADGKSGTVAPSVPSELPPVRTFDVDNLLSNGVQLNSVGSFIPSTVEQNDDAISYIQSQIDDNELHEF